jgi:hypothetical protein
MGVDCRVAPSIRQTRNIAEMNKKKLFIWRMKLGAQIIDTQLESLRVR